MLGKTFTKQGLAAALGHRTPTSSSRCSPRCCARRCCPCRPTRARPSAASTRFLQDIVKRVAYETLSRKERKARHLATAEFLLTLPGSEEDEIVEVVAAHYIDALEAAPDAADAGEIRDQARAMLVRAGERAASLAATRRRSGRSSGQPS